MLVSSDAGARRRLDENRTCDSPHAAPIGGSVLSLGSGRDEDGAGGLYQDYFPRSHSYLTSEVGSEFGADLVVDVRSMPEIEAESFDCIFCVVYWSMSTTTAPP